MPTLSDVMTIREIQNKLDDEDIGVTMLPDFIKYLREHRRKNAFFQNLLKTGVTYDHSVHDRFEWDCEFGELYQMIVTEEPEARSSFY